MNMRNAWIPTLLLLAMSSCDTSPTEAASDDPFMLAHARSVEASVIDYEHRGEAQWSRGTRSSTQQKVQVSSHDPRVDSRLFLQVLRSQAQQPGFETGSYDLVPRNFRAGDNDGATAMYILDGHHYVAESGTLTITDAYGDYVEGRVEGHFEVTVVLWCTPSVNRDKCFQSPASTSFSPDAPRLHVHGEFSAAPPGVTPVH